MENDNNRKNNTLGAFMSKHPVLCNILIICAIAVIGIYVVFLALAIFTKHGESDKVPGVENMSYTRALEILHDRGFRVDIRDSIYRDDVRPGYVVEQFPKANATVKPGRKIFLYINAVHPKEVVLDDDNHPSEYAMKGQSQRSAQAKLEELGFKNVRVVKVLGSSDRVVKVLANGRPVRKMQKVAVNAAITLEVSDGRLEMLKDSLQNEELRRNYEEYPEYYRDDNTDADYSSDYSGGSNSGEEENESEYLE